MKWPLFVIAFVLLFTIALLAAKEEPEKRSKAVSYSKDVFPIIKRRCLPCHAVDSENPSELFMETYEDMMKGGKHGSPVIPKKGSESLLFTKLHPTPPFGDQMPIMTKKKLSDEEIETIKKWIDEGAKKN